MSKAVAASGLLQDLWDDKEAAGAREPAARAAALSLQPARRRSSHHEFWRRQHQLEVRSDRSGQRQGGARAGGQGQRRRPAVDQDVRLCRPLHGQARGAHRSLPRRSARRRDGRVLPALRLRRQPRRVVDRHARCTRFCRTTTSITCIPTGRSRWPPAPTARRRSRSSTRSTAARSSGCRGSGPGSSWR